MKETIENLIDFCNEIIKITKKDGKEEEEWTTWEFDEISCCIEKITYSHTINKTSWIEEEYQVDIDDLTIQIEGNNFKIHLDEYINSHLNIDRLNEVLAEYRIKLNLPVFKTNVEDRNNIQKIIPHYFVLKMAEIIQTAEGIVSLADTIGDHSENGLETYYQDVKGVKCKNGNGFVFNNKLNIAFVTHYSTKVIRFIFNDINCLDIDYLLNFITVKSQNIDLTYNESDDNKQHIIFEYLNE